MNGIQRLSLSLAAALGVWLVAPPVEGQRAALALFTLIGFLWMTQAIPLTITALLVPLLAVAMGLASVRDALAPFANPIIFLFLGGFVLATSLQRHGLDRELANWVLRRAGGRRREAILLLFAMTALLSMWISNTATATLMLPLALGLLARDEQAPGIDGDALSRERAFVLLGVAFSASLGGLGSLVGSPPNAIAAAHAGISFAEWLLIGVPLMLITLPLMLVALMVTLRPSLGGLIEVPASQFAWTRERRFTVAVFVLAAVGWIGGAPLAKWLGIRGDFDTLVALFAIVALVGSRTLTWKEAERGTDWGILLLFGGGLALGQIMDKSGASRFLADQLLLVVGDAPLVVALFGIVAFIVFMSELASNTAIAALLIPVFAGIGAAVGMTPQSLAVTVALAASCGFMLPVATPPNALVFGTGQVPPGAMLRSGALLDLFCIIAITAAALLWL